MVGDIRNIVVIQSLEKAEKKTGEELYNDIIKRGIDYKQPPQIKMSHKFHDVADKNAFIEILQFYVVNSEYMHGGVLLHFEMHGATNLEGLILADGFLTSWKEIVDILRQINVKTKNNLYITMATCFGRYMYKGVDLEQKSPYSGYISASKEVKVHEVIEDFTSLFETLIESGNLVYSYIELEKEGSSFYYKDSKTTFETNFEEFRKNQDFKKQILESASATVREKGGEIADDTMAEFIYQAALKEVYEKQIANFKF